MGIMSSQGHSARWSLEARRGKVRPALPKYLSKYGSGCGGLVMYTGFLSLLKEMKAILKYLGSSQDIGMSNPPLVS